MDVQEPVSATIAVEPPWELALTDQETAVTIRRQVRDHWRSLLERKLFDDVLLVVSELVTNTYSHTERPRVLRVAHFPEGVLVEVGRAEPSPTLLESASAPHPGTSRASTLLDRMCSGWGVLPEADGNQAVWALLPR
jgi:hypothetical protein